MDCCGQPGLGSAGDLRRQGTGIFIQAAPAAGEGLCTVTDASGRKPTGPDVYCGLRAGKDSFCRSYFKRPTLTQLPYTEHFVVTKLFIYMTSNLPNNFTSHWY